MRFALFISAVLASSSFAADPTHQVKLNGQTFTLPQGFTIELAAKAPHTLRPVAVAFDNKGRLYVTESSGSNEPAAKQLEKKPHSVLRLEDTNADGVFDKVTTFADKMMFPQGIMWLDGSVYVGAPPHIWKLTDADDDGIAEKREIWFDGGTLTGCLNDLHGPYPGPDGYIYWTKGAFAKQTHTLGNGKKFETRASHIFRMKPDKTGLDVVMTGGMDNPVDVVFTPKGDIIFSTTFFQHPGDGLRDGLIHAIYGGIYGKDHDVIHDKVHKWTSPNTLPVMTHLGPAAPCGLHRYTSDQFGPEFQDNLFCAQFNLRTVSRHVLKPEGSTYKTENWNFVVSDSIDFHPTDVIEDRDGSLLIVDTGGWYKLCCPTSAIVKDDVHGAIYRVRKTGMHKNITPRKAEPLPELYYAALNRDASKLPLVKEGLASKDAYTRRLAAHAAGRIGKAEAIPWLVEASKDRGLNVYLAHALIYAFIEINQPKELIKALEIENENVQYCVLIALDQLGEKVPSEFFDKTRFVIRPPLLEAAWWSLDQHPEYVEPMVKSFKRELLNRQTLDPSRFNFDVASDRLFKDMSLAAKHPDIQKLLAEMMNGENGTKKLPIHALVVMKQSNLKQFPSVWVEPLARYLENCEPTELPAAFALLRSKAPKPLPALLRKAVLEQIEKPINRMNFGDRLLAITLLPVGTVSAPEFLFNGTKQVLRSQLREEIKSEAAEALGMVKLTEDQLVQVAELLPEVGPLDFPKLLLAFERNLLYPKSTTALFKSLMLPKVRALLREEQLKSLNKTFAANKTELAKLQALLDQDRAKDRARVEELLTKTKGGDVRRGQVVFYSQKAACSSCHKIGYVGGLVGPDLSRIGAIRTERDLLEAIVLPNATFVRSYEPVKVNLLDGRTFNGILKSDNAAEIVLVVSATETLTLKKADVDSVTAGSVSVMPSGLDQQLTVQELADLVAFLKSR